VKISQKQTCLLVFISGHGFGHASRMRHLLNSLHEKSPHLPILVAGTFPSAFVTGEKTQTTVLPIPFQHDVGVLQADCITMDFDRTFLALQEFQEQKQIRMKDFFKQIQGYSPFAVVSDSSSFAFPVAEELRVPGFFVGNFTWVDIYREFTGFDERFAKVLPALSDEYLLAKECWQLPLHTRMEPFSSGKIIPTPHLAPPPSAVTLKEWSRWSGLSYPQNRKIILLSFGGYDFKDLPMEAISRLKKEIVFLTTTEVPDHNRPENLICVKIPFLKYSGLIRFCDAVMTKPGYGILADCLVEKKPILYTERGPFAEYPVLTKWLDSSFPSVFLSRQDFITGRWNHALEKIFTSLPVFPPEELNGAEVMAERLLSLQ
jgi:hypothetical protein